MNAYLRWNNALAAHFFNTEMAGRSVHFNVNQSLIFELEQELVPEVGTFLAALRDGPPWAYSHGTCQRALDAHRNWRYRNIEFPPYLTYLGLFVLAAGADGDFSPNAYYPRLRQMLDDSGEGMFPSFQYMRELWHDLEEWSIYDKRGEFGIFHARIIGGKVHIGYPLGQLMLTEQERKELPRVFYDSGLDPTSTPPADELARALRSTTAKSLLLPRTIRLVENRRDIDLYTGLLDTVADELAEWDGEVEAISSSGYGMRLASASLRICLNVDPVAGSAQASIRCKLNREFPEDGLLLNVPGLHGLFQAEEYLEGWSLPIKDSETGEILNASLLNWDSDVTMRVSSSNWRLRLYHRPVRLFLEGTPEGLPGLVETHALPQRQPFYMAYSPGSWPQLERWVADQCRGFHELEKVQGLPRGWRFARVEMVTSDEAIRGVFSFLSFPPRVRLRFVRGIRSSRGNNFFNFAPPSVVVDGGASNLEVFCNERHLPLSATGGLLALPQDLPTESRIVIEARSGNSVLDRLPLFLTGDFSLPPRDAWQFFDNTGSDIELNDSRPSVAGAHVRGRLPVQLNSAAGLLEDLEAEIGTARGFLVGQTPGQVVEWPLEPFPTSWNPTWAITKKKRKQWEALFIGDSLETASPIPSDAGKSRAEQAWKRILWHRRKRIRPPTLPGLRALWNEFQEVARNV